MSALRVLQDDVTAIAPIVGDQLPSKVGRNESMCVLEASRCRGQDYAVRHKFRSPDDRSSGRCQLGIAGESKAPTAGQSFPLFGSLSWHLCGSGCSRSGNADCAVETPTRIPRGRCGAEFRRRLLTSSPVSLACVTSTFQELRGSECDLFTSPRTRKSLKFEHAMHRRRRGAFQQNGGFVTPLISSWGDAADDDSRSLSSNELAPGDCHERRERDLVHVQGRDQK